MAEVSQKIKYVKLDDGVSFSLARTNPKLTTNTKLMYNGKKMYMESYASDPLLNRMAYKNVSVKQNSTYNKDIASFLTGSGSQAYKVYQNLSDIVISDSYDNQFETLYWCGAERIDSSFYSEKIGFIAPLYLREKLPNYFLIFRLNTPSNYNLNIDNNGNVLDSSFDFKTDILDKSVLIKTFDLRQGSVLGNYINNYVNQEGFEYDKSMYVNFSNCEVTYYGINKVDGVFEKKVESFENELLKNDNPVIKDDKWFTDGFERNNLIFPYVLNIEYLFDDDNFKHNDKESCDFARYIGVYCNTIEFGEFVDFKELKEYGYTQDNAIYYFEDNKNNLHRYSNNKSGFIIDGKDGELFDKKLISGFEKERITGYAEPLDIYEGFINRAQYGFEILKPLEPGDWIGIEYNGHVECYFADNKNIDGYIYEGGIKYDMLIGEYSDYRFSVNENSTLNDIAETLVKCVNKNKKSKFEAKCSDNVVVFYAKREGKEYNGRENGGAKILMDASLLYNRKISLPISKYLEHINENYNPIEYISDSDNVIPAIDDSTNNYEKSSFGDYYKDYFCGACDVEIDRNKDIYKNIFKIYAEEYIFFDINRYLKTNNGDGRGIYANMIYINSEGKIDTTYRIIIVDDVPNGKKGDKGYDISVSSTNQVEILDKFRPNYGVFSWFPVKDFDFDINYSTYGQYGAFYDECNKLSKKISYNKSNKLSTDKKSNFISTHDKIRDIAKSPFFDDYGNSLETEYNYYFEQIHPNLCLISKTSPYVLKWGYYDEQKDSCENPYRLNVNKIFGVSNLSANVFLNNCDEDNYTHNMPYYMTFDTPDYYKEYQYIPSDDIYRNNNIIGNDNDNIGDSDINIINNEDVLYNDCVEYWINMFMSTEVDNFSKFFSGKKYGKRFDRKYSRFSFGDRFHNPTTLFRGVKFEAVRQYNGVEKISSEYNNYKFSFIYIPIINSNIYFNNTIYFVKNDTFKFIVGIVFVNTMLGTFGNNVFNGDINYFNKCFLYAAYKDLIEIKSNEEYKYDLTLYNIEEEEIRSVKKVYSNIWKKNYNISYDENKFNMWISENDMGDSDSDYDNEVLVSTSDNKRIIGVFSFKDEDDIENGIKNIEVLENWKFPNDMSDTSNVTISSKTYYENYDTTIYRTKTIKYYGFISCRVVTPNIKIKNIRFVDVCDVKWKYDDEDFKFGYIVDVSNIHFTSQSLKNILINMGVSDSVVSVRFYDTKNREVNKIFEHNPDSIGTDIEKTITVDYYSGNIKIINKEDVSGTIISTEGYNGETIESLMMDIEIKDTYNTNFESFMLNDWFSVFNLLSAYNITENINDGYNIKYYSTIEDNKYKIRVVEPDSIEIEDKFEAIPVKITQKNEKVIGSIDIKLKENVDKISKRVINRYSGFYNPIFNDILYYDDYTYTTTVGRLKDAVNFEMPYSNTNIDYNYSDKYGDFGVIKNMYYHKTNVSKSDKILSFEKPIYPLINEYALDYRDYNIFSSSWDDGYFISQDDLNNRSICEGIGSMKETLCMFGSKYLNLPDDIFIDTFENGKQLDENMQLNIKDNTNAEILYKEINNRTVRYHLFIEKRLKRYLKDKLFEVFSKYINKNYSFGNKGTIDDDIDEYVEKNLLKLYKVDKVYMYTKGDRVRINNNLIENDYLKYVDKNNEFKIKNDFPVISVDGVKVIKDSNFTMGKTNEFDRTITYNLKPGFKESFGFSVSFKKK